MAIPYCKKAKFIRRLCPRSPGPVQLSIVAGCTAMTESRGTSEQDYSFSIQCKSESFLLIITALIASFPGLPTVQFLITCRIKRSNTGWWEGLRTTVITAKKQSPNKFFAAGGWLPCVQRTKLRTICNHYLKESTYSVC